MEIPEIIVETNPQGNLSRISFDRGRSWWRLAWIKILMDEENVGLAMVDAQTMINSLNRGEEPEPEAGI